MVEVVQAKRRRDDLTSVLARIAQLEAANKEYVHRVAALEELVASQFGILPPALAEHTITPKEAAYELGVTVQRVSQLIKSGRLRAVRVGGRRHIDAHSVGTLNLRATFKRQSEA